MRPWALALAFIGALAVALAGTMPMSLALLALGAEQSGVSAAEVSGSIWSARLKAAHYRSVPLGDVAASFDPLALLTGSRRIDVNGPFGRAALVQGNTRGVESAEVVISAEHLGLTLPLSGHVRVEGATLLFADGRCARAEGRIVTDVLQRAFRGPDVAGAISCDGDAAIARLQGRMQGVEVDVTLRLEDSGRYRAETQVVSADPLVRGALALAGFAENGGRFVRLDEGAIGT